MIFLFFKILASEKKGSDRINGHGMEEAFSELYTCRVRSEINGGLVAIKNAHKITDKRGKKCPYKVKLDLLQLTQ